jgi:hypothetical protein
VLLKNARKLSIILINLMLTVFQEEALPLSSGCCHRCYFVIVALAAPIALAFVFVIFWCFLFLC